MKQLKAQQNEQNVEITKYKQNMTDYESKINLIKKECEERVEKMIK